MNNNNEKNYDIKEAIIKVIAFFDMFDYVLTEVEIWRMLDIKCELREVIEGLENMTNPPCPPLLKGAESVNPPSPLYQGGILEEKDGFYFLAGQEKNIEERLKRYNFTDRKFKRARLVAKIFKFIPWIRMIAVGNLIGAHNLKDDSDIDFFIIAEDKKVWLTRWFCVGVTKIFGLRPRANNSRDKICLSFYASERAMDLSGLKLKNYKNERGNGSRVVARDDRGEGGNDKEKARDDGGENGDDKKNYDVYFTYWLAGLTPLYDNDGTYEKLVNANKWLYERLPNWPANAFTAAGEQPGFWPRRRDAGGPLPRFYRDFVDLFFGGLEPQFKKLQLRLLPPELKNLMNLDSRVVVNDKIIKLHANDRREEYRERYLEKIKNLL